MMKRIVSFVLSLVLVLSLVPMAVFAEETLPAETETVAETTMPNETEAPTEPEVPETEAPTEPEIPETEVPTEPEVPETEAPTEPEVPETEAPTEPEVPETEAPTEPEVPETEAPTEPEIPETEAPTEPAVPETQAPVMAETLPAPTEIVIENEAETFEASIEASGKGGPDIEWTLNSDGLLTISGSGPMYEYMWDHYDETWQYYSYSVRSVKFTGSITKISDNAFAGCMNLTSITIPASVTEIGYGVFDYCESLEKILVSVNNTSYAGSGGLLLTKDKSKLICCPAGKSGTAAVPEGVITIGQSAFQSCTKLTKIQLPSTVEYFEFSAFWDCPAPVTIASDNPLYTAQDGIIYTKDKTELVMCPGGFTKTVKIPSGTRWIRSGAFMMSAISGVVIPEGVEYIGNSAFYGCNNLTSVNLPASVTEMDTQPFAYCSQLEKITVASGNPSFASKGGALYTKDMTELVQWPSGYAGTAAIPSTVKTIWDCAFQGCYELTGVTIPSGVTRIPSLTFEGCYSLKNVTIPASVEEIGWFAFDSCDAYDYETGERLEGMVSVKFLGDAPEIDDEAFYNTELIAYYPSGNSTWTSAVRQNYGGYITWKSYTSESAAPSAPVLKAFGKQNSGKPKLTWDKVDGAVKYELYYAPKGGTYKKLTTTAKTTITHTGADAGTVYNYKVRAVSADGTSSAFSNVKSVRCYTSVPTLSARAKRNDGKPTMIWKAIDGASCYQIRRRVVGTTTWTIYETKYRSYTNSGAEAGKLYEYQIRALDSSRYASHWSGSVKMYCYPEVPTLKVAMTSAGKPKLSWDQTEGADGYRIYVSEDGGAYRRLSQRTSTTVTHTGAKAGVNYKYYVVAYAKTAAGTTVNSKSSNVITISFG